MPAADEVIGVWRLESYCAVDDAGETSEGPLGPSPQGVLIYTSRGYMSVSMMRTTQGPEQKLPDGQEAFMGYAGTWRIAEGTVVHEVDVSAHPHQVNTEQVREVVLEGDQLTLYGTRSNGGPPQRRMLRWRRAGRPSNINEE